MTSNRQPQEIIRPGRAIGRCSVCKTVYVEESADWRLGGEATRFCYATEACKGTRFKIKAVIGVKTEKTCGARCLNAIGPSCDCSCSGINHGSGH